MWLSSWARSPSRAWQIKPQPSKRANAAQSRRVPACEQVGMPTAEGAYDTRRRHTVVIVRVVAPIIPTRRGRTPLERILSSCADQERNAARRAALKPALAKVQDRNDARSRIEAKMRGPSVGISRRPDRSLRRSRLWLVSFPGQSADLTRQNVVRKPLVIDQIVEDEDPAAKRVAVVT